jgi:MGT family glycosyltransferase
MSKILVIVEPVEGHFNPLVPIMEELSRKGNELVCITGRKFKDRVEKTGAAFHPLPMQWDFSIKEIYELFPQLAKLKGVSSIKYYLKHVMYDPVPGILEMLKQLLEKFPADVIISDTFMLAGVWITELDGPPSVRISVLPLTLPGKDIAPTGLGLLPGKTFFTKLRNNILNGLFEHLLFIDVQQYGNNTRKKVGLPTYDKSFFYKAYELATLNLHTSTPAFEYFRERFPTNFRFIGPVLLSPDSQYIKPEWWHELEKDIPVVLINQGTIAKNYEDLILPSIEALKDGKMVVLAVPVKKGDIHGLPENVHAEQFIPFGNLLPHVDLMITNGGFGSTQNALAHGIPVIVAGATEDKMEVAARVENSGAGINLRKQNPTSKDIKNAVKKIFSDPSYKKNAEKIQADFAKYDATKLAVEYIEELIETSRK